MFFNRRRRNAVFKNKHFLTKNNYKIVDIDAENSLSISSEGFVRICPWDNDENSIFNIFSIKDLCSEIEKHNLEHECDYCSKVKITNGDV